MIYFYPDEIRRIVIFSGCPQNRQTEFEDAILKLCSKYEKTNRYFVFCCITTLGVDWSQIVYGKNLESKGKPIFVNLSYLGVQETAEVRLLKLR